MHRASRTPAETFFCKPVFSAFSPHSQHLERLGTLLLFLRMGKIPSVHNNSFYLQRRKIMKTFKVMLLMAVIALSLAGAASAAQAGCCASEDCCASCSGCAK
jgi:hypothetical protein